MLEISGGEAEKVLNYTQLRQRMVTSLSSHGSLSCRCILLTVNALPNHLAKRRYSILSNALLIDLFSLFACWSRGEMLWIICDLHQVTQWVSSKNLLWRVTLSHLLFVLGHCVVWSHHAVVVPQTLRLSMTYESLCSVPF